jgi:hypothetical protein
MPIIRLSYESHEKGCEVLKIIQVPEVDIEESPSGETVHLKFPGYKVQVVTTKAAGKAIRENVGDDVADMLDYWEQVYIYSRGKIIYEFPRWYSPKTAGQRRKEFEERYGVQEKS